jgi:hypothetical protein
MRILTAILISVFATTLSLAQTVFTVDNLSKQYYGKIQISDTSEVFSKGWVAIYDRKTNKQLIRVVSDELAMSLHKGKAIANIKSLPYGEQSLIMYDDFNFDGKKDFAVCDGQNSCYHGPSFKIYLANANSFLYSKEFTRLAQEYCGMFHADPKTKKIHTMTKSGCCWQEASEFIVVNNKPKAIRISTYEQDRQFHTFTEEVWNGKSMTKKTIRTIDIGQEGIEEILSFTVRANEKHVILYINDGTLNYALLRKDGSLEFAWPAEPLPEKPAFLLEGAPNNLTVTFKNANASYRIYERSGEVGMAITADGKTYNWIGDVKTKEGSLNKLRKAKPGNMGE